MRLVVGDRIYLKLVKGKEFYEFDDGINKTRKYSKSELENMPFPITKVRGGDKKYGITDDVCVTWLDGNDWWWGQIGDSQPWTKLFMSELEYQRNRKLESIGI